MTLHPEGRKLSFDTPFATIGTISKEELWYNLILPTLFYLYRFLLFVIGIWSNSFNANLFPNGI